MVFHESVGARGDVAEGELGFAQDGGRGWK